jgi:hypothetical protein
MAWDGVGRLGPKAPSLLNAQQGNRTLSDIFISYKSQEQDKAEQLAVALEKQGWSVWWDPHLRAGERFDDAIQRALSNAKCVIALLSRRFIESTYVWSDPVNGSHYLGFRLAQDVE